MNEQLQTLSLYGRQNEQLCIQCHILQYIISVDTGGSGRVKLFQIYRSLTLEQFRCCICAAAAVEEENTGPYTDQMEIKIFFKLDIKSVMGTMSYYPACLKTCHQQYISKLNNCLLQVMCKLDKIRYINTTEEGLTPIRF